MPKYKIYDVVEIAHGQTVCRSWKIAANNDADACEKLIERLAKYDPYNVPARQDLQAYRVR